MDGKPDSGLDHHDEGASKIRCAISEDLDGNRDLPLLGQSGQAQEHYAGVLLSAAVHQLAETLVAGDEDRRPTVRSLEHIRVGSSGGWVGDVVNVKARATKCVHYLALDAFVREVAHSSAYGIDRIKAKDVDGVLDSRQHTLPSQRWIGI